MSDKLLPCPFCGSDDIKPHPNVVVCKGCDASGPDNDCFQSDLRTSSDITQWTERAVAAWNARAKPRGGE